MQLRPSGGEVAGGLLGSSGWECVGMGVSLTDGPWEESLEEPPGLLVFWRVLCLHHCQPIRVYIHLTTMKICIVCTILTIHNWFKLPDTCVREYKDNTLWNSFYIYTPINKVSRWSLKSCWTLCVTWCKSVEGERVVTDLWWWCGTRLTLCQWAM